LCSVRSGDEDEDAEPENCAAPLTCKVQTIILILSNCIILYIIYFPTYFLLVVVILVISVNEPEPHHRAGTVQLWSYPSAKSNAIFRIEQFFLLKEKDLLRYYYYIHNGIATKYVAGENQILFTFRPFHC
jgi:hypothetical protein